MFTGLIQTIGSITVVGSRGNYKLLTIKPDVPFENTALGESVAVDGCCLTVTRFDRSFVTVEVSPESVRTTIIGKYNSGQKVNLERALLPTDRLGGHMVTGHVDCLGEIVNISKIGGSIELSIRYPEGFAPYLVPKGSVAINGISLTVNELQENIFEVNIIPHTRQATTVQNFKMGDSVNLEFDIVGKYIARMIKTSSKEELTINKLIESGWNNTGWSKDD
ncbi:MAG: riboflavin synthase [Candidatus Zixiibacteriota bacterium]|nr:MAG: riboflavin synthase [candidate division Zixibacteria bacterium]